MKQYGWAFPYPDICRVPAVVTVLVIREYIPVRNKAPQRAYIINVISKMRI